MLKRGVHHGGIAVSPDVRQLPKTGLDGWLELWQRGGRGEETQEQWATQCLPAPQAPVAQSLGNGCPSPGSPDHTQLSAQGCKPHLLAGHCV